MNSLELINKLILEKKTDIKVHKEILQIDNSKKVFHTVVIRECEEIITALQQIKTILEAWEVVSNPHNIIQFGDGILEIWYDTQKEENTLKKALEVEDDR